MNGFVIARVCNKVNAISKGYWNGLVWTVYRTQAKSYANECTAKGVMTRKRFKNGGQVYFYVTAQL